jgi:hypothetical protein
MLSFLMLKNKTMVCTSIEQSNRLVELGINPKTADMGWFKAYSLREEIYKPYIKGYKLENHQSDIPAWSIYKLIEIISIDVTFKNEFIVINNSTKMFNSSTNVYDNLIDVIEYLIQDNKINTEFIL